MSIPIDIAVQYAHEQIKRIDAALETIRSQRERLELERDSLETFIDQAEQHNSACSECNGAGEVSMGRAGSIRFVPCPRCRSEQFVMYMDARR